MIELPKPELTNKLTTIRYDGKPPETSTERKSNKYPDNEELPEEKQSEIFEN